MKKFYVCLMELFSTFEKNLKITPDAFLLKGFVADDHALQEGLMAVTSQSPFRHMVTTRGFRMSVAMTNCGARGWVSDRKGYRYDAIDPETGKAWPSMPVAFLDLAQNAASEAGYKGFLPDACLVNRYDTGAKLSLHQDKDDLDLRAPIVSVSLGVPAVFLFGGLERSAPKKKINLAHGDVVVWGGPSRLAYHGILPLKEGFHPFEGKMRINLTFRKTV